MSLSQFVPAFLLAWSQLGWLMGLVLVALLAAKELLRAYGGPRTDMWVRALNVAVVPLLVAFGVAVVGRVALLLAYKT